MTIRKRTQAALRLVATVVALMSLMASGWLAMMPAAAAADPLPAGKKCPDAPKPTTYVTSLGQCNYTGDPIPGQLVPDCQSPYTPLQNTFECQATPINDPATNPSPSPNPTTITCGNPIDQVITDPGIGAGQCGHGGIDCQPPYHSSAGAWCITNPELSKPGADTGSNLPEPKCAVETIGRIVCPPNVGNGTNDCYWREARPGSVWTKVDCGSAKIRLATAQAPLCTNTNKTACDAANACGTSGNCDINKKYITPLIQAIGVVIGLVIAGSIIWAGIDYSRSADSAMEVTKAKQRILGAVIAFIMYLLFGAFLNWIIPGGIL